MSDRVGLWIARALLVVTILLIGYDGAHAQSTKAQLNTEIDTQFPDNAAGQITASRLRTVTKDMVNSVMPTAPVVSGNFPNFNGTTGLLQDSGVNSAGIDGNVLNAQTAAYALQTSDCGKTVTLGGTAFYTLTVGAASGFPATCSVSIANIDTGRAKLITISGVTFPNANRLWPGQTFTLKNINNTWVVFNAPGPWIITSNTTFNVDTASGNDNSDCLGTGSGACALLSTAIARFCQIAVVDGAQITFQTLTGQTHAAQGLCVYRSTRLVENSNPPQILGDTSSCANANNFTIDGVAAPAISAVGIYTPWAVRGMKLTSSVGGTSVLADNHSRIYFGASTAFPTVTGFHMRALYNSFIEFVGDYCITGNAVVHANAATNGQILIQPGLTVTLSNSPVFTYFAQIYSHGLQTWTGTTFIGTAATGTRYSIDTGGGLYTNGAGAAFLPGSVAGTATNPGWYN